MKKKRKTYENVSVSVYNLGIDEDKAKAELYIDDVLQLECQGNIQPQYIKDTLNSCHYVILALQQCVTTKRQKTRAITRRGKCAAGFAFVTQRWDEDNLTLHMDLLCSAHGNGSTILNRLKRMARDMGAASVTLDAIHGVVQFYKRKHGFKYVKTLPGGDTRMKWCAKQPSSYNMVSLTPLTNLVVASRSV